MEVTVSSYRLDGVCVSLGDGLFPGGDEALSLSIPVEVAGSLGVRPACLSHVRGVWATCIGCQASM